MATKHTDAFVTFAASPALIKQMDQAAERELLTRSAWLRRVAVQAASARMREPEFAA
jgi:hypothetical protein